jgi:hypothetical protein
LIPTGLFALHRIDVLRSPREQDVILLLKQYSLSQLNDYFVSRQYNNLQRVDIAMVDGSVILMEREMMEYKMMDG